MNAKTKLAYQAADCGTLGKLFNSSKRSVDDCGAFFGQTIFIKFDQN